MFDALVPLDSSFSGHGMFRRCFFFEVITKWRCIGTVLLLCASSILQTQCMEDENRNCGDPADPDFNNALHVIWNKRSAKIVCMENFFHVGQFPSAICNENNRWEYYAKCVQHRWISPFVCWCKVLGSRGNILTAIPLVVRNQRFTITVSDTAEATFIVIRAVFRALIGGVQLENQVLIHTVYAGEILAQVQFNQSFPFTVDKKAHIKLVPESDVKLGIFVNGTKLMSYDSPTPLAILRHVDISNESYVNSADVLCKICDIKSAPKFPNIEVTRWTKKWPQQGIIRCRSDTTWRGNTPPRATCVGDIWSVNGQCLPRFIYNAVPGQVYTLPRVADAGHQVSVKGTPLTNTGFNLVFTREKMAAVTYSFNFKKEKSEKIHIDESTRKMSFGQVPLVVGRPFIIRLKIAKDNEIDALVEDQDSLLAIMTSSPLTGPQGITGFGVAGDVAASVIDLQNDLEYKNWSFPKLIGRVSACNSAPLIPNGRATLRNKVYPLAEVTCNENFVWSTEGPSVVTCDRSLGWQVNGTCNQAVWSNKLAPAPDTYPLPLVMRIGHEICISAKVGTSRFLDILFRKDNEVLFSLKIRFKENIEGTQITGGKYRQSQQYSTDWSVPQNGIIFIKVKVTTERELEFQLNSPHKYKFNMDSSVKYINNLAALEGILKIDLACHLHLQTFCTKDLVPSVNHGSLLWVPSQVSAQALTIKVTCENNFTVVEDTDGVCDPKVGWQVTGQCRPRENFVGELMQPDFGFKIVPLPRLGQKICLTFDTEAVKSKRSRIKMRTQNGEVAYAFMYDTSSSTWTSQVMEGTSVNSMARCNLIYFEEKEEFSINLTMIQNNMIVMTAGESADNCTSTSLTSINDLRFINSEFPMRSINMECEALEELQKKFLCSKLNAPIWKQAITIWNFIGDSAEAAIVCQPGFVWSGSHRPMAVCDGWIGWNSDGDCIPKRWNTFDMSEYPEGVPLRRMKNGQVICFNIPVTTTSTPTITINTYSDILMNITVDSWQNKLSRKGELARQTSNGEGIPITLTALESFHVLVKLGEEFFVVQSQRQLYFVRFLKTNFNLFDVNVVCEQQS